MSHRSLAVDADLTLSRGPAALRIRSAGGAIDVDVPVGLWSERPDRAARRRWLGRFDRILAAAGLTARIRVLGLTLVRLGAGRRATLIGRALGLVPEPARRSLS